MRIVMTLIALTVGGALLLGPTANGANKAATRTVGVGDNFFSPKRPSVSAGTTVRWRWRSGADTHNVKLARGPRGVKGFKSKTRDAPYSYTRKLSRRGTYSMTCTLHQGMTQRITVK